MKRLLKRWLHFPFFVQLIWLLCVLGVLINLWLIVKDILTDAVLIRLHIAYLLLYAGQVGLILAQEKYVYLLTLLQGILALLTTVDFIFVPVLQVLGNVYYWLCSPSVEALKVYQYVFVSVAFTLQMACAAYLWGYLKDQGVR